MFASIKIAMPPKVKRDPAWAQCQLDEEGKKYAITVGRNMGLVANWMKKGENVQLLWEETWLGGSINKNNT